VLLSAVAVLAAAGASSVAAQAAATTPSNVAVAAPEGPVGHAGKWMVDRHGRVVVLHGLNVPSKTLPAYPSALGFGYADAGLLAASGFNAVRLTVERYALEPAPGKFDDGYLAHMADTVGMLAGHGILSLIDFHQDEYGPVFNDNGFPAWMTMTDGLPNMTQVGFPGQYLANPALNRAFDHLWADDVGPSGRRLQADDATMLAHAARYLAGQDGLLGYEILNEPWPGSQYPTCTVAQVGCPVFDRGPYSAYYHRVIPAVRGADPSRLVFYEPVSTFNQGVPTSMVPPADPRLGFAFHNYPLCSAVIGAASPSAQAPCTGADAEETATVISNAEAHAAATGNALLETEFGANTDTALIAGQLGQFDKAMVPWMFWSYTHYIDPYAPNGTLEPPTPANINQTMLQTLARPYPQLVAGTPTSWRFDPATKVFAFEYSPHRADGHGTFPAGAETSIAVPAIQYPHGYQVRVTGGSVASAPDAPLLRVRASGRSGPLMVTVAPPGTTIA
jgi:endoglycosylceramidase